MLLGLVTTATHIPHTCKTVTMSQNFTTALDYENVHVCGSLLPYYIHTMYSVGGLIHSYGLKGVEKGVWGGAAAP